jgi:hypothetical protein
MQEKIRLEKWGVFKAAALATYFGPPWLRRFALSRSCVHKARQATRQPAATCAIHMGGSYEAVVVVCVWSEFLIKFIAFFALSLSLSLDRERASERRSSFFARKTISSRNLANNLVICFSKKETLSAKLSFH